KFDSPATLIKSHMEADRVARSRNVIERPDPKNLKDWKGHQEIFGWEPNIEKYSLKEPQVRDGVIFDKQLHDGFRKIAHENRIPAAADESMYNGMWDLMMQKMDQIAQTGATKSGELQAALDKDWGSDKGRNTELAKRAMAWAGLNADQVGAIEG